MSVASRDTISHNRRMPTCCSPSVRLNYVYPCATRSVFVSHDCHVHLIYLSCGIQSTSYHHFFKSLFHGRTHTQEMVKSLVRLSRISEYIVTCGLSETTVVCPSTECLVRKRTHMADRNIRYFSKPNSLHNSQNDKSDLSKRRTEKKNKRR